MKYSVLDSLLIGLRKVIIRACFDLVFCWPLLARTSIPAVELDKKKLGQQNKLKDEKHVKRNFAGS